MKIHSKGRAHERAAGMKLALPMLGLLALAWMTAGCLRGAVKVVGGAVQGTTSQADGLLNEAMTALRAKSSDWPKVLQDLVGKLSGDGQKATRAEVSDLLKSAIAARKVELHCLADFIGDRMREGFGRIRAALLGQEIAPAGPKGCEVVP